MPNDDLTPERAGPDGPPGLQVQLLTAADLQDSLMVATNDLERLQRLLTDATETLMGHFYGATAQIQSPSFQLAISFINRVPGPRRAAGMFLPGIHAAAMAKKAAKAANAPPSAPHG